MPSYQVSTEYFFRELGRKVRPGEVVELPESSYEHFKTSHPGLLKAARLTTQGYPTVVKREAAPIAEESKPEAKPEAPAPVEHSAPVAKKGRKPRAKK